MLTMPPAAVWRILIDAFVSLRRRFLFPLPPHLALGGRRCSTLALCLGGVLVCVLWAATFKFCRQQGDFEAGISALMFFRE